MDISNERMERIQRTLKQNGLEGLFCRLSEHVFYFTGYWPRNHVGAAVVPAEGSPVLVMSEMEAKLELSQCPPSKNVDVVTFPLESASVMRGPNDGFTAVLPAVLNKLGLSAGVIGIEQSLEGCNIGIFQGEVKYPASPTWEMLKMVAPKAAFKDASDVIMELRAVKSPEEVQGIQLAIDIAGFGLAAARRELHPGMKETELAAVIESAIHTQGTGYQGVLQARGYAAVYSGPRSASQWVHYAYSSDRVIEKDEIVIIELGSFADGYWSDLTRNLCAGTPSKKAAEMFEVTLGAQKAAIDAAHAGVKISDVVQSAYDYFDRFGYAQYWPHGLGHGVGMAYHEGPPLHIANQKPLQTGMVLTVEPGVYLEEVGGIRPEDIILVGENSSTVLSHAIPHQPMDPPIGGLWARIPNALRG